MLNGITNHSNKTWNDSCPNMVAPNAGKTAKSMGKQRQWIAQNADVVTANLSSNGTYRENALTLHLPFRRRPIART